MDTIPLVYLIFGIPNSGRREVIFDLIEGGIPETEQVIYLRPEGEAACAYDEQIESLDNVSVVGWKLNDSIVTHDKISVAPKKILFLAPGLSDPSDCAEGLKTWSDHNNCQIARLITVTNCHFLSLNPGAKPWFDACIHFSDVVLLNRREEAGNKWVKGFETAYKKACIPARFVMVKKGRVSNPAEVLYPETRRVSLYFDELLPIEDDECQDEQRPDDTKVDAYIERLESGHRSKPILEIAKFF